VGDLVSATRTEALVHVLTYAMRFHGRISSVRPGVFETAGRAPAEALVEAAPDRAGFTRGDGDGASLLAEMTLTAADRFAEEGTVAFDDGDAVHFRSPVPGCLETMPGGGTRGGVVSRIEGGAGRLAGVRGHVCSSFLATADGELVDARVAVIVMRPGPDDGDPSERRQA
jgi:hypothetical protein